MIPADSGPGDDGKVIPPDGWTVLHFDRLGSTNDEARARATDGAAHGTVVWADAQDSGRGRRGRSWSSLAGNLFCTTILRPDAPAATAGQLGFVIALATHEAVKALSPTADAMLKWPNDLLVGGRKISGILLESALRPDGRTDWVIAGLGVNVAAHPENSETPAISLNALPGASEATAAELLETYLPRLRFWYDRWALEGFELIREAWLERARGLGGEVRVRLETDSFAGLFEDIDMNGALIVRLGDGTRRRVNAGDVFFPHLMQEA
ncbi:biotin--[acetyl-CoA-carboxylase] ligase [Inquilinus sp. CAU 1745]|uniref:biotin--[acetyl-CoA-carboxylase] ligase n=1 Tax=Inquilinus sp. CAU 1745 TaxID=3140369 RepID=UPI00325B7D39